MKQTLQKLIKEIETNALIRELFQDNNMKKLVRKLPASSIQTHHAHDTAFIEANIEKWEKEGIIFIEKPEIIAAMLRSLFIDRKSTRLNSSHVSISYAVFCLKKKKH